MKLSNNILSIVVNPFAAPLDSKGRACALVACDPEFPSGSAYIGAKTKVDKVARPGNPFGPSAKVHVHYSMRAVNVADTGYYRAKLTSGEVLIWNQIATHFYLQDYPKLIDAANAAKAVAMREHGLSEETIYAAWREQGLGDFAPKLEEKSADPPDPDKPTEPAVDTLNSKENPQ